MMFLKKDIELWFGLIIEWTKYRRYSFPGNLQKKTYRGAMLQKIIILCHEFFNNQGKKFTASEEELKKRSSFVC